MTPVQRFTVKIPSTKLNAHRLSPYLPAVPSDLSASVEDCIYFCYVVLVVHYPSVYFDPRVGFERHWLCSNDHLRRYAAFLQQARGCRRPLEAEHFFPIPDAS